MKESEREKQRDKNGRFCSFRDGNKRSALRFKFLFEPRDIFSYCDIFPQGYRFVAVTFFIRLCIDSQPSETKDVSENRRKPFPGVGIT